jgi:hypothetical protein
MQGGDFVQGFVSGGLGSLGAEAWGGAMKYMGYEKFAGSTVGTVAFGVLSGGVGAELSGGNFWQGAVTGGIVAGLNHAMHKTYPPDKFKGRSWRDKDGIFSQTKNGGYSVDNSPENFGYYREIEEVSVVGKLKTSNDLEKLDKAVTSIGIVSDYNESLLSKTGTYQQRDMLNY